MGFYWSYMALTQVVCSYVLLHLLLTGFFSYKVFIVIVHIAAFPPYFSVLNWLEIP